MTIEEEINQIIEQQYNNFRGRLYKPIGQLHKLLRQVKSDKEYLAFLKKQQSENPRPIYTPPTFITN